MVIRKVWAYMLSLVIIHAYFIYANILFREIYFHTHNYNWNLAQNILCVFCHVTLTWKNEVFYKHIFMHTWIIFWDIKIKTHSQIFSWFYYFNIIFPLVIFSPYFETGVTLVYPKKICQLMYTGRQGMDGSRHKSLLCQGFSMTFGRKLNQT